MSYSTESGNLGTAAPTASARRTSGGDFFKFSDGAGLSGQP
jgi:hypothetical protein